MTGALAGAMDGTGWPRVAVVGCGLWGRNHVRNHAELGSLVAVVDRNGTVAEAEAARYGVRALSFAQALEDADIDALVFALPPSQNLPLGRAALAAGKHLFVEKPLALSVADGEALCETAERHGRVLMVGHILRHHPAFLALERLVADGRLGRLLSLTSTRLDFGRVRREEDALWALAPHDISMVLALAAAAPANVAARGGWHTHPTIADATSLDLGFADGVRAEIRVSWLHPLKEQRLVAVGTDAMAVFDDRADWATKLVLHPDRLVSDPDGGAPRTQRGEPEPIALERAEPLRAECLRFLRAIRDGLDPVTDGREALRVLSVLERASAALLRDRPAGAAAA